MQNKKEVGYKIYDQTQFCGWWVMFFSIIKILFKLFVGQEYFQIFICQYNRESEVIKGFTSFPPKPQNHDKNNWNYVGICN